MKKINVCSKILLIFLLLLLGSCSNSDDIDAPIIDLEGFEAQIITVTDVSNMRDGRDIELKFNAPINSSDVNTFKIFIAKTTSSNVFDNSLANDNAYFLQISNTQSTYTVRFLDTMKDTDGDLIEEDVDYRVTILSEYTFLNEEGTVLSDFSETFQLISAAEGVFTIPVTYDAGTGLDGITIDSKQNVYVSNFGTFIDGAGNGKEVFKITPEGQIESFGTELNVPGGIVTDKDDNIFVNNSGEGDINKLTPEGEKSIYAHSDIGFAGLVMDENGIIYSGGFEHSLIQKISTDGTVTELADDNRLIGTVGIAYHQGSRSLFTANFNNGKIYRITMDGLVNEIADFETIIGYITEMNGDLYATLFLENQIAKITLDGQVEIIAGEGSPSQEDGALLEASFNMPNGIIGDPANNVLYVSDWGSPRVSKIQL